MSADSGGNGAVGPAMQLRLALETSIPSDVRFIEPIISLVQRQCRELSFPSRQCSLNIPVALAEALSNAIRYGNADDPRKAVRIRSEVDAQRLVIEVRDEGEGFDFGESLRDPTKPENIPREDGRGLFLMTKLMHQVECFTQGGNVIRLTLRRE